MTFSFTSGHQNVTVHAEVHTELEPPVKELGTHGKKPENQPHHFVFSSEPTAPLCFFKRTNRTTLFFQANQLHYFVFQVNQSHHCKVMRSKQANQPHQFFFSSEPITPFCPKQKSSKQNESLWIEQQQQ